MTIRIFMSALIGLVLSLGIALPSQARQGDPPPSWLYKSVTPLDQIPHLHLPAINAKQMRDQDDFSAGGPLRFAQPRAVSINPVHSGSWEDLPDGGRLWRQRITCAGATDLNFGFSHYQLPTGATLHFVSDLHDYYEGPYVAADNQPHHQLWTPIIPGDQVVIELYLPAGTPVPTLELAQVGCGYRDLFNQGQQKNLTPRTKQGSCNIDVICPEGDAWRDPIRSVGLYSRSGTFLCTGTLLADVPRSQRSFFLTAHHCGVTESNAPSVVVYWNYESPVCGQLSGGSLADNQTGAVLRATRADVDFTLLELTATPDPAFNVFYAGWDRSNIPPSWSIALHHPNTEEKAISIDHHPPTTTANCIAPQLGNNTHWRVGNWEQGTTEPGSSGGGLWSGDNQRLIGFLSGGLASCTNRSGSDCFGKFAIAWDGSNAASRLRDWLDPTGQQPGGIDGFNARATLRVHGFRAFDQCVGNADHINQIWEPGETVEIYVDLIASGVFTNVEGVLTSLTAGVTVTQPFSTWPTLRSSTPTGPLQPFTIRLNSNGITCDTPVRLQLQVTSDHGETFYFPINHTVGSTLTPHVPVAIPDVIVTPTGFQTGRATSALNVPQGVTLNDVNVRVNIQHTYIGDLTIRLRSPAGTEVVLLDRPGLPQAGTGCKDDDMEVTFADAALFDPENHCAGTRPWLRGVVKPAQPLAAFNGQLATGTWTLIVEDAGPGDTGALLDWELITAPALRGICTICTASVDTVDMAATFVAHLYLQLYGRPGDEGGIRYWGEQIANGLFSAAETTEIFFNAPEFQQVVGSVARLYFASLGRVPDSAGLNYWVGQFRAGVTLSAIAAQFITSAEFQQRFGSGLTTSEFVDLLYLNVLGRAGETAGRTYWINELNQGLPRATVLVSFSESPENIANTASRIQVTLAYEGLIGRAPTSTELITGSQLALRTLIANLLTSPEYRGPPVP